MKKTQIWVIVLTITILCSTVVQAAPLGSRPLSLGQRGEDVEQLQYLLKRLGYFNTDVTGYYGNITRQSVLNFQSSYKLTVDGHARPETIYRLKYENGVAAETYTYVRSLRQGYRGYDVKNLQDVLKKLGYLPASLETTCYFGQMTDNAVRAFQKDMALAIDGSVGPASSKALNNVLAKAAEPAKPITKNTYKVKPGDTLWEISKKYNLTVGQIKEINKLKSDLIYVGQELYLKKEPSQAKDDKVSLSYIDYRVNAGDTIWKIANNHNITQNDLLKANGFTTSTILYIGQLIRVPVYTVPVKETPGPEYGEYLDWWTEAQYVLPFNTPFEVTDFYTGTSFMAVRTFGANHADCEPLTTDDTVIIKNLWDRYHTSYWTSRPITIDINGRRLAASMSAMLHAGLDAYPNGAYIDNRSGGYGYGQNFDAIKGNKADGHFDIHFLNSTTHNTGTINSNHQKNIRISAGLN